MRGKFPLQHNISKTIFGQEKRAQGLRSLDGKEVRDETKLLHVKPGAARVRIFPSGMSVCPMVTSVHCHTTVCCDQVSRFATTNA